MTYEMKQCSCSRNRAACLTCEVHGSMRVQEYPGVPSEEDYVGDLKITSPNLAGVEFMMRNCVHCTDYGMRGCKLTVCKLVNQAATPQPPPLPGERRVLDFVINDLNARAIEGKKKYGTYLYTHNGRDALMDAYQEALDLCMYLKQALMERGAG
jgi:hypothetical protein